MPALLRPTVFFEFEVCKAYSLICLIRANYVTLSLQNFEILKKSLIGLAKEVPRRVKTKSGFAKASSAILDRSNRTPTEGLNEVSLNVL